MEKLQKALEKAREERQRADPAVVGGAAAEGAEPDSAPAAPTGKPINGKAITYSKTKVVGISARQLEQRRLIIGGSGDALADTFRILRTQVLHKLASANLTTLAVVSPRAGEGKTLIACNLALSISLYKNYTTLLVDVDLRRPNVHTMFALTPKRGLSDHILNDTPIAECLINPGVERLVVLPAGSALQSSSETLSSPKMVALAEELKTRYPDRIVIYDLPPLLTTDDALVFLKHVDCCLLVVEQGGTASGDIQRAMELLDGRTLIGTVLNKAREKHSSYYY